MCGPGLCLRPGHEGECEKAVVAAVERGWNAAALAISSASLSMVAAGSPDILHEERCAAVNELCAMTLDYCEGLR